MVCDRFHLLHSEIHESRIANPGEMREDGPAHLLSGPRVQIAPLEAHTVPENLDQGIGEIVVGIEPSIPIKRLLTFVLGTNMLRASLIAPLTGCDRPGIGGRDARAGGGRRADRSGYTSKPAPVVRGGYRLEVPPGGQNQRIACACLSD